MTSDRGALPKILTVGELAERSGVSVSAIHFWERQGLIEGWRTGGNQRRYERSALRRVAIIKIAQTVGIPLSEIKARFDNLPPGKTGWTKLAPEWRADLDRRNATLTSLRTKLDGCIGCGCVSLKRCPLHNPDDRLSRLGPGPRRVLT